MYQKKEFNLKKQAGRPKLTADQSLLNKLPHLTLLHMMMMVYSDISPFGQKKKEFPLILIKEISDKLYSQDDLDPLQQDLDREFSAHKVTAILRRRPDKQLREKDYTSIYNLLNSDENTQYYYLKRQCEKLKESRGTDTPEEYARKLWIEMGKKREWIDQTYLQVFVEKSPWLFKEHKKVLEEFDVERTYKLLTVAIAISLNLNTSTTDKKSDPLDILCSKFLYAAPLENLPTFTLSDIFDTLFSEEKVLAVKRGENADYTLQNVVDLKERDKLYILLPWLSPAYDLHLDSDDEASALMNNRIGKNIGNSLRGFFAYFSESPNDAYNLFISQLKENLVRCSQASQMCAKHYPENVIQSALNEQLSTQNIYDLSESFYNILRYKQPWNSITTNKFWNGGLLDISLPQTWDEKEDKEEQIEMLYQYIAAYVLIALYCVKADGDATPEKRKQFQTALIQAIHKPTVNISTELVHARAEIEKLKADNEKLQAENENLTTEKIELIWTRSEIRKLMDDWLQDLHQSSDIDRRAGILKNLRRLIQLAKYSQNEMIDMMKALDKEEAKSRQLKNNPPGWDNGGK